MYTLDLTTKNNLETGFKCRHKDVTAEMVRKALKALLEALTRACRQNNWHCIVYAVVSETDIETRKKIPAHAHLVFYGTPCCTIADAAKRYWTSHGYGNSIQCERKKCKTDGKLSYIWAQKRYQFFRVINYHAEQGAELFRCSIDDARMYLTSQNGRKKNIFIAWLGYNRLERYDSDENSSTKLPMIMDKTRQIDVDFLHYLGF